MNQNTLIRIIVILAIYLGLRYFGGYYGQMILYPITLMVTFLHEFGHALGALITGGSVEKLVINQDGSGYTTSRGGSFGVILMGGYIGSAILGNLLFYIGARKPKMAQFTLYFLASAMAISGFIWYESTFTTGFLVIFALALYFIASKTRLDRDILMFLGLASIVYIVQDFNVGPRSDLEQYAEIFGFIPVNVWMYIWLSIVVILCLFNLRLIFRRLN